MPLDGGAIIWLPPRVRTTKVVLPLMYTVAFIVRGNVSYLFGITPLDGVLLFGYRGADGELKLTSFYWLWMTTPTEDAKASSAFFHKTNFAGAYGVLPFHITPFGCLHLPWRRNV